MVSPGIDDMSREWCFLAKTTTVIGMPFQPDVTQVTYDGSLYTGSAELCFFWGPDKKPLFARQRTFLDGWIPMIEYGWRSGGLDYHYEAFAAALPGEDASNTVDFVRFTVTNGGRRPERAVLTSAFRHRVQDYRIGGIPFDTQWTYRMAGDSAIRNGKLVYMFPEGGRHFALPGKPYSGEFEGGVTARQEVCLSAYDRVLKPGQTLTLDFKMPRVPVEMPHAESAMARARAAESEVLRLRGSFHSPQAQDDGRVFGVMVPWSPQRGLAARGFGLWRWAEQTVEAGNLLKIGHQLLSGPPIKTRLGGSCELPEPPSPLPPSSSGARAIAARGRGSLPPGPRITPAFLDKLRVASYDAMRAKTIAYWKQAVLGNTEFDIPEPRVQNTLRASLVHMMLATRTRGGKRFQTDGLPYPDLFLSSFMQSQMAYDFLGRPYDYEQSIDQVLARQNPDGIFMDTSLPQNGQPLIAAHGQTLFGLCNHYLVTGHAAYARKVWPAIVRGVAWIAREHARDEYGLMPPSWPYDAEMIKGRYTSHNLWCLLAVRVAVRMARELGETDLARQWTALDSSYTHSVVVALRASARPDDSVPTGLYKYVTGEAARAGFKEYQTDQDWENILLAAPTEALAASDPLVKGTVDRMHRMKFREGVMTYRDGQHIHQYVTANVVEQEMAMDDQWQALCDYYHMILHNGPTGEGFENLVEPWTRQVADYCPPPHAWAATKMALLTREMLLVERGGRAGMDQSRRDLHLFSLLSPAWVKPGQSVGFRNVPCEMGHLSARLTFTRAGADLALSPRWTWAPRDLVVHIPYFVRLTGCSSDGLVSFDAHRILLKPGARWLRIRWSVLASASDGTIQKILLAYRREPDFRLENGNAIITPGREGSLTAEEKRIPPAPLTFATVLKAYRIEYARRFRMYLAAGGRPVPVEPPAMIRP